MMILPFLVPLLFLGLGLILRRKESSFTKVDTQQRSPYECGFSPFQSARHPFSIYFFLVAILFVIFDVELIVVLPVVYLNWVSSVTGLGLSMFLFILVFGLYHEWREGSLNWPDTRSR